ncbi:adenosylmethionine decarboxylase [Minwuia thermotolerans]|uniref:S-adenosylmethionine decarboxylase proenzyme n=1 Tax=Minwuia thermotolerans TaxID=2056226 RepID=A0A2M9G6D1_9PROT|nr:adenosylmethionine decarboxylase [Minwuia thermotolerans]PJK31264.1 adenosylmethionine decarboxylase [Minwuia thermotolerans]
MDFTTSQVLDEGLDLDDRADEARKDFFIVRDGECFAGTHLLIDVREAEGLDDIKHIDRTLRACVEAAGATLLSIDLHHFTPNGGVSGVAILAESHISIHSWPEYGYAALDVFMCGDAEPQKAVPVLKKAFRAGMVEVAEIRRGKGMVG